MPTLTKEEKLINPMLLQLSAIYLPILVPRQVANVLLRRLITVGLLHAHRPHRGVRDLRRRHRELYVSVWRKLIGNLIEARESESTHQLMGCVSTWKSDLRR